MASFGWSAGDIVATITLVSRVIQCMRGAHGAREHFQELVSELQGLSKALHEISELAKMPGQIPEIQALKFASCLCNETLQRFYEKIRPFEGSLGAASTKSKLQAAPRMVRWELLVKKEVPELRSYIAAHVGSLNLRLTTALLKASSNSQFQLQKSNQVQDANASLLQRMATGQTTVLEKINKIPTEDTIPKLEALLAIAIGVWKSQNEILSYLAKASSTLPAPDLDHTWAQSPVKFEDALGRRFIIPSEYDWDKLEAIIQAQFKNGPGCAKVRSGEYELFDRKSGDLISKSTFFGFIPGAYITMSIIVGQYRGGGLIESCTWFGCKSSRVRRVGFETMTCMECQSIFRKSHNPLPRPMKPLISDLIANYSTPKGAIDAARKDRHCYKNVSIYFVELPTTPAKFREKYHRDYIPSTTKHQLELDSSTQQMEIHLPETDRRPSMNIEGIIYRAFRRTRESEIQEPSKEAEQTTHQRIPRGLRSTLQRHISRISVARLNFHTSAQEKYSNRKPREPKNNLPDRKSGDSTIKYPDLADGQSRTVLEGASEIQPYFPSIVISNPGVDPQLPFSVLSRAGTSAILNLDPPYQELCSATYIPGTSAISNQDWPRPSPGPPPPLYQMHTTQVQQHHRAALEYSSTAPSTTKPQISTASNRGASQNRNTNEYAAVAMSSEAATQWPLDRVLQWLANNQFSNDWQETFKGLNLYGTQFLGLGVARNDAIVFGMMHQQIYPRLAKECVSSGTGWDQERGRNEGKRLRRLIRGIVTGSSIEQVKSSNMQHESVQRNAGDESNLGNMSSVRTGQQPQPGTFTSAASEGLSMETSEDMSKILQHESFAKEDVWESRPPPEMLMNHLNSFGTNLDPNQTMVEASSTLHQKNTEMFDANIVQARPRQRNVVVPQISQDTTPSPQANFRWPKVQLINKTSSGRVYLGIDATTGNLLAVKQYGVSKAAAENDKAKMKKFIAALYQEIDAIKDLEHVNIVQYLGCEGSETSISIFLEYVSGDSIGGYLRKHGKFEESVICIFTRQILNGLAYLHREGVLHRDLKADNILLDLSGTCKISNFGISKNTDNIYSHSATNSRQDSVFWMPPEVIHSQGRGYTETVDIWSLGCVVLEMFTGRRPWGNEEAGGVTYKLCILNEMPPIPDHVTNTISPAALAFMYDCFQIDPSERPRAQILLSQHPFCDFDSNYDFRASKLFNNIRSECPWLNS